MLSRPKPEQELKQLDKRLKLSVDQQGQILPLLKDCADTISKLLVNSDLSIQDKFVQIVSARNTSNEKIRPLLSEAQKKIFDRILAGEHKRWQDEPTDFGPGGPPDGPPPGDAPPPPFL
jgi:Flp pilus assembly CpaF family ATPase